MAPLDRLTYVANMRPSRNLFAHAGWAFDAYPEIPLLNSRSAITVAEFQGPGVVDHIQMSQNWFMNWFASRDEGDLARQKATAARGVIVEIYYDGELNPSVRVPVGDFFGDLSAGAAMNFTSVFFEKGPGAYHSWLPMPFARSFRLVLVNETQYDYMSNTIVEGHTLGEWDPSLAYLHATWQRDVFQATPETERVLTRIDGSGHLLGRSWSLATDEPLFTETMEQNEFGWDQQKFHWIMEANNEFRIDGEQEPTVVYCGSEDSFGFHWGFTAEFAGLRNGIVYLGSEPERLGLYRFWDPEPIRFQQSLEILLTWKWEGAGTEWRRRMIELGKEERLWVDYATTTYWYQATPGFQHSPLPELEQRVTPLLRPDLRTSERSDTDR
jgi:hypothetical protein